MQKWWPPPGSPPASLNLSLMAPDRHLLQQPMPLKQSTVPKPAAESLVFDAADPAEAQASCCPFLPCPVHVVASTLVTPPSPHPLHRELFLPRDVENMLLPLTWMVPAHHALLREAFIFLSPDHPRQNVTAWSPLSTCSLPADYFSSSSPCLSLSSSFPYLFPFCLYFNSRSSCLCSQRVVVMDEHCHACLASPLIFALF